MIQWIYVYTITLPRKFIANKCYNACPVCQCYEVAIFFSVIKTSQHRRNKVFQHAPFSYMIKSIIFQSVEQKKIEPFYDDQSAFLHKNSSTPQQILIPFLFRLHSQIHIQTCWRCHATFNCHHDSVCQTQMQRCKIWNYGSNSTKLAQK